MAVLLLRAAAEVPAYHTAVTCWHFLSRNGGAAAASVSGSSSGGGDDFSTALGLMAELATNARVLDEPHKLTQTARLAASFQLQMAELLGMLSDGGARRVVARGAGFARGAPAAAMR